MGKDTYMIWVANITIIIVFVVLIFLWAWTIKLGLKKAKSKNYSRGWMWFGVHPAGALIMVIILHYLRPRIQCITCGAFLKDNFILCPYCREAVRKS
jgi:hypothetical protein